jgi:outer membrane protein TolC
MLLRRLLVSLTPALLTAAVPAWAYALQPLTDFLEHAKTWNPDNRAARATVDQREAEVSVASGNLEPNLQFNGIYTRNEFEVGSNSFFGATGAGPTACTAPGVGALTPQQVCTLGGIVAKQTFGSIPNSIIQPYNQLDGNIILTVPIINIANWDRRDVSKATLSGAKADEANAGITVQKNVTRDYFLLLGYEAVLQSAIKNLDVAQHNVKLARDKKESGTGSELDVQRALADSARAEQQVTAAQLNVTNSRRDLYSLTGVTPLPAANFPDDDLHPEAPLEGWLAGADTVPSVKSAEAARRSAEEASHAARTGWLPTLNGIAEEKFTNATAFAGGHSAYYLLQLSANWKLDFTVLPQIRQQNAIAAAARANEDKVRQAAADAVYKDWQQVKADVDASRSARAQVSATKLAASLAEDRYENGVATQLDVLQARQDAFAADVAKIQADADLAYARTALRLDSGRLNGGEPPR